MLLHSVLIGALWIVHCKAGGWFPVEKNCFRSRDQQHMMTALQLASRALGQTRPNPCVGCIITDVNSSVVGQGWHARAGLAHAEVVALSAAGDRAVNGTAYVSLEPCNHYGRTPPCTQALIRSGIKRVVVGMVDPDPRVSGRGIQVLRDHGIDVTVMNGTVSRLCEHLNAHFVHRVKHGIPHITAWYGYKSAIQCIQSANRSCTETMRHIRGNITAALLGVDTLILSAEQLHHTTIAETRELLEMLPVHVSVLVTHNNYADTINSNMSSLVDKIRFLRIVECARGRDSQRKWYILPIYNSKSSDSDSCHTDITAPEGTSITVLPSLCGNTTPENHHSQCAIETLNAMLNRIGACTGCNGALLLCDTEAGIPAVVDSVRSSSVGSVTSSAFSGDADGSIINRVLLTRCTSNIDTVPVNSDCAMGPNNDTSEAQANVFADWCDWLHKHAKCDTTLSTRKLCVLRYKMSRDAVQRRMHLPRWLTTVLHGWKNREAHYSYSRIEDQDGGVEKRWRLSAFSRCSIYRIGC